MDCRRFPQGLPKELETPSGAALRLASRPDGYPVSERLSARNSLWSLALVRHAFDRKGRHR